MAGLGVQTRMLEGLTVVEDEKCPTWSVVWRNCIEALSVDKSLGRVVLCYLTTLVDAWLSIIPTLAILAIRFTSENSYVLPVASESDTETMFMNCIVYNL